ncbi:MAG: DNA-binding response regulator [Chloroflexi bacterium RBG_13_52_12]|nr:MAG: DNA-binding response regulator [Chloroflexi bacterium RBG_13_52_12]
MSKTKPIKILLVDDHAVVRSGLGAVLMSFDDMNLVGEAGNGEEAVHLCRALKPDVVLMDLMMPVMDGVTATRLIHENQPDICIIALTSFGERELVEGALKAGAAGYLLKTVSAAELIAAIKAVAEGKTSLSPEAAQVLVQGLKQPRTEIHNLTEREKEILTLMADGLPNHDIAERLVVSQSTVKFHVSNILSKLEVSTRTEAVALALKHKLVK